MNRARKSGDWPDRETKRTPVTFNDAMPALEPPTQPQDKSIIDQSISRSFNRTVEYVRCEHWFNRSISGLCWWSWCWCCFISDQCINHQTITAKWQSLSRQLVHLTFSWIAPVDRFFSIAHSINQSIKHWFVWSISQSCKDSTDVHPVDQLVNQANSVKLAVNQSIQQTMLRYVIIQKWRSVRWSVDSMQVH